MRKREFFRMKPGTLVFDTAERAALIVDMKLGKELTFLRLSDGILQRIENDEDYTGHLFVREVCKAS